jgi:hypothetical protein
MRNSRWFSFQRWLTTVPLRFRSLFRHTDVEQELDEELRFHLDQRIAELRARPPHDEAHRAALRAARRAAGLDPMKPCARTSAES